MTHRALAHAAAPPAIGGVINPLNRAVTKNVARNAHPMSKFEHSAVACFFARKGLRLQQIQKLTEQRVSEQAFELPAPEK
jgi:hypothetical protein